LAATDAFSDFSHSPHLPFIFGTVPVMSHVLLPGSR
jgi:hypothetical protein